MFCKKNYKIRHVGVLTLTHSVTNLVYGKRRRAAWLPAKRSKKFVDFGGMHTIAGERRACANTLWTTNREIGDGLQTTGGNNHRIDR